MNREQLDYAKRQLMRGVDLEALRTAFREGGYEEWDITQVLARARAELEAETAPASSPVVPPAEAVINSPQAVAAPAVIPTYQAPIPTAAQAPTPIPAPQSASSVSAQTSDRTQAPIPAPAPSEGRGGPSVLMIVIAVLVLTVGGGVAFIASSLNSAQDAGRDASAQQALANIRSQAEIHYNSNGLSYAGMCETPMVRQLLDTPNGQADCVASDTRYRVSAPLSDGEFWCIEGAVELSRDLYVGRVATAPVGFSCQ